MKKGVEIKKEKIEKIPIAPSKALQIALEDSETSYFIQTNFSHPEKKPEILTNRWISKDEQGYKWNIEVIEKPRFSSLGKARLLNIALIEVDSKSGRIIRRQYLRSILASEYKQFKRKRVESNWLKEKG